MDGDENAQTNGASNADAGPAGGAAAAPAPSLRATAEAAFDEVMGDDANADRAGAATSSASSAPPDPQAGQGGAAATQPGDVFGQFGVDAGGLPDEVRGPLGERLQQISAWRDDVQRWAEGQSEQLQQQAAAIQQYEQRLVAIAQHPRFQAALASLGGNGTAAPVQPPQFETEAERILWERGQALEQQMAQQQAQMQQAIGAIGARFQAADQQAEQAAVANHVAELRAIHQQLDAEFPELAGDRRARQAWHAKAASLLAAYEAAGEPVELARAMREAAQLLHYPHARNSGAAAALTNARQAARRSTLSDGGGRSEAAAAGPKPGESLSDFARRMAEEGAASGV